MNKKSVKEKIAVVEIIVFEARKNVVVRGEYREQEKGQDLFGLSPVSCTLPEQIVKRNEWHEKIWIELIVDAINQLLLVDDTFFNANELAISINTLDKWSALDADHEPELENIIKQKIIDYRINKMKIDYLYYQGKEDDEKQS